MVRGVNFHAIRYPRFMCGSMRGFKRGFLCGSALALAFSALIPALRADDRTSRLIDGLTRHADTFQKIAPEILGRETLEQRVLKPPPHFKPRIGEGARKPIE